MKPGRDLDALIAEHVLGWHVVIDDTADYHGVRHGTPVLLPPGQTLATLRDALPLLRSPRSGPIPYTYFLNQSYSTDLAAAWRWIALPILRAGGAVWIEANGDSEVRAGVSLPPRAEAHSDGGAAAALCLAALKARGISTEAL